jgi:septal ring factor EnvC (AmiA/AmiB activator)
MLGRSYKAMGRWQDAERAFNRIGPSLEKDAALLADLAEVMAQQTRSFDGRPRELLQQALKIDGENMTALLLAGTDAFENRSYSVATTLWSRLLKQLEPGSEDARMIEASIARAQELGGSKVAKAKVPKDAERSAGDTAKKGKTPAAKAGRSTVKDNDPGAIGGAFASLRGKLRLPVRGDIAGRFGSARAEGGTNWKGVFIRAAEGAEVKAIAAGAVVFSDWLRGFGNLLIVDHGDDFLSIYGNNESLLAAVGSNVTAGQSVATVGNSGGNPESGLYFELRHRGQPFDPLKWVGVR